MDDKEKTEAVQGYIEASEALYASLGLAVHDKGGVVAFVTPQTVEALERLHAASRRLGRLVNKDEAAKRRERA